MYIKPGPRPSQARAKPEPPQAKPKPGLSGQAGPEQHYPCLDIYNRCTPIFTSFYPDWVKLRVPFRGSFFYAASM